MSHCFSEPYEHSSENVKVELDLSNYAIKSDLNEATGIDTSTLSSKKDLAYLKNKVDNLNFDKLKTPPSNLSNLSNVVDNDVAKKLCMINWLPKLMLPILRYEELVD